ncbi:carbohydrate ABC transporter membrane protein 1, CUT1 family [Paenibacillus sp. UNCCL117]|uniref:ABC transporter permease n=1 Tax=unclassified Paenibacillus TaxID=185978 RepID=UPI00088A5023|nr:MULTISPECIES: ABC transporter permease subunit [unclassified Paenibacillus]SDC54920.1 putative aldouronate transport system permease protein [Paenibacillus sp. cl123]SFW10991.1 carbohydrate ABC transporter membrane protein 1, CUT1 family [Paenibacillus sp. UNCCL117]
MLSYLNKKKYLYLLLFPCVVYFLIFNYMPMYGVLMAFKDFDFSKGILHSPWVGLDNFKYMFSLSDFYQVFWNSFYLGVLRIVFGFPLPIILALMLNEIRNMTYQRVTQTIIYLPHFISWVVIGGILVNFLSPAWGLVNIFLKQLGFDPVFFLADPDYFRPVVVLSTIWKEAGWGSIIYLAAIAGINSELYESASIDGASRLQKMWYVTLPGIKSTIVILLILRLGQVMNNGFEQIFVLQNPMNLNVSEVFETYAYRVGILGGRFSFGTTVGLFTSVIGLIFLLAGNRIAKLLKEDGIW